MNGQDLLDQLRAEGIHCFQDGDDLVVRSRQGSLSDVQKQTIARYKRELLQIVSHDNPQYRLDPDPAHRYDAFPLTDIQSAYWLGRNPSFELGKTGIHVYEELECENLDLERLNASWSRVVERHDSLRAVVLPDGRQRVLPHASYRIEIVDLRGESVTSQRQSLGTWRDTLSHKVYAAESWPMFDLVACRTADATAVLLISIDALHVDMRSFQIIFGDWVNYYCDPGYSPPPYTVTYRDYVLALKQLEQSPRAQDDWAYWTRKVTTLPPAPPLPRTKPLASIGNQAFRRLRGEFEPARWTALKHRTAATRLTPSGIALAVFAEVLALWSSSTAFSINVTLFNALPLHADLKYVAGDFTSMILVEGGIRRGEDFTARARRLQSELTEGLSHRLPSGVRVLREFSRLNGLTPGEAAMPVVFTSTLNSGTQGILPLKSLGRRIYNIIQTPQVTLDLQVSEEDGGLTYHWDFVDEIFPAGVPEAMFTAYGDLLRDLADKDAWTATAPLTIPARQALGRAEVNSTAAAFPSDSIPAMCWAQPLSCLPAVITSSRSFSRGEIHESAMRLAGWLREHDLCAEEPVALVLPKGPLQIIAAHGVLASGGAYVPIDHGVPPNRLSILLGTSGVRFVITDPGLRDSTDWPPGVTTICEEDWSGRGPLLTFPSIEPRRLGYVIYTSGSTGTPKGVMIEHQSVVNRVADVNRRFHVTRMDRLFGISALQHDLSVYDLFGSAAAGAALVLPDAMGLRDPEHWAGMMVRLGVTIWNSVPAFLEMLVEFLETSHRRDLIPVSLRLVLLAGDWIPVTLPARLRALIPNVDFVAMGGPTETTVWDICYPVGKVDPAWRSIPYGKPMANARYFVLDSNLRDRPDWVAGELCISGTGLARQYCDDPSSTAEKFVEHPVTGERLYRSGDVGRYLPDGNIEFLGRLDSQLKVGGHRIEAGEVEAALLRHPSVSKALVRASGSDGAAKKLCAYVVLKSSAAIDQSADERAAEQMEFRIRQLGLREDRDYPHVFLPSAEDALHSHGNRRSTRRFATAPVPWATFGAVLRALSGITTSHSPIPKYKYPSAGSLYPVRTYISVRAGRVDTLGAGTYYYHPVENRLSLLTSGLPPDEIHEEHNRCMVQASAFSFYFIAHLPAIEPLYGVRAKDYCMLEAGYMGQLLMLEAERLGLGLCPIGNLQTGSLTRLCGLAKTDVFLHAMAGGLPLRVLTDSYADCERPVALSESLRNRVRAFLPEYMIPAVFHILPSLPVTPNGKLDTGALDYLECGGGKLLDVPQPDPPASKEEEAITTILETVLARKDLSVTTRFFELGCNSLHLVTLLSRLRASVNPGITIADLFASPSVRLLAERISAASTGTPEPSTARDRGAFRRWLTEQRLSH